MKKSFYLKPEIHILQFNFVNVLSTSGKLPGIDDDDGIGKPVPPVSDGGIFN